MLVYLNLWDIFRFSFRQLKDSTFFHKVMVAEKIIFLQLHNTILQIIISECKNEKP